VPILLEHALEQATESRVVLHDQQVHLASA